MSPRTTDVSAPGHNIHAAPSPAVVHSNRAPSSTATTTHVQNNGVTTIPVQRRKGKPLSSGWKSLAWTKPHSNNLHQSPGHKKTATATPSQQQQQSPPPPQPPQQQAEERDIPNGRADHSPSSTSHHHRHHQQQPKEIAVSVEVGSTKFGGGPTSSLTSPPREEEAAPGAHRHHRHHKKTHKRRPREEQQPATVSSRGQPQTSFPAAITATGRSASVSRAKRWIPSARSEEFSSNSGAGAQATTFADFLKPVLDTAGYQTAPVGVAGGLTGLDALVNHSAPGQHRRQSSGADQDGNTIVMERSVSDSSIVTASDFGAPKKSNLPTILTDMKDEDAVVELVALLAKGRGLPVVKHAGSGGGKSRKLLKFNEIEGWVALCGMLPPYFKTKIMVRDIDRVDAKWCCVVVHAKGRSPVRLEVDSFATADTLRVGLMAASRAEEPTPPADEPPPEPVVTRPAADPEQGLASVRPGHSMSQVYDPDAALSVAALLAKEMEDERILAKTDVGVWSSSRSASKPGGTPEASATPVLKRSMSMTSNTSAMMTDHMEEARMINNRRSLPRDGYNDSGPVEATGGSVIDQKAALRRLYGATEGRGMGALKRHPNGKGRSRVTVRSKIREGTIGWAHVLPPFSRKAIPVKELLGASRSSRVVTVNFKGREPVLFETDRLTDALILEQGFVSLAVLQKSADYRS